MQQNINTTMLYRNDITGLRAIAVLSVLIFHIFPNVLVGGYLGVDIFFVISGFLITSQLLKEQHKKGSISLINFYKRRIQRIAPATIFIILVVLVLANLLMDFSSLKTTAKESIFATLGLANIYFYTHLDASYFAPSTKLNPLLHLWSLGVEEQFYFLYPFIFLLLGSRKKIFTMTLIVGFFVSVIWASIIAQNNQMFAFYSLPTRSFELIIGTLGAIALNYNYKYINLTTANILAVVSFIIIILGLGFLSHKHVMPSYLSLIVVIPTAFLLYLGHTKNTIIHKMLRNIYLKHIGLWSFSIYLIHWVILAFYKIINGLEITLLAGIIILIVSVLLGGLAYKFIEQTFRYRRWNIIITILIFIALPFVIAQSNYSIIKKKIHKHTTWIENESTCLQNKETYVSTGNNNMFKAKCRHNITTEEPNIILWGDSNATHYIPTLNYIAKQIGFGFRNIEHGSCPAFTTIKKENFVAVDLKRACDYNSLKAYKLVKNYDVVILASAWVSVYRLSNGQVLEKELDKTLKDLSKSAKLILVLGNAPVMDNLDIRAIVDKDAFFNNNKNDRLSSTNIKVFKANEIVKKVVKKYRQAYYIDFTNILCKNDICLYKEEYNSLNFDKQHLSPYGSLYIGKQYMKGKIDNVFYKIKKLYKENPKSTFPLEAK